MKILRIAVIAPQPFIEIRGTSMANFRLAQILADAGHAVDVITYPFGTAPAHPGVDVHRCRPVPFIRSVGIGFSPAKLIMDMSLVGYTMNRFRHEKLDCIHAVEEGVFIGATLGWMTGTPVVYDMDSIMSQEIASSPLGRIKPLVWMVRAAERWAIRRSALVMTICEAMADYVRQVDSSKSIVVIPDVPVSSQTGGPDPERARVQLPADFVNGRKLIVYTGSLAGYQGMDLLVSAMPKVVGRNPEAALLVVGGDDKSIARLSKLAHKAGVVDRILFLGKRPPEQIPDFLALADILVSPRRGGINPPGKIYTYMQSGRPIVATRVPAHTAVLDWGTAMLINPTSAGIADGLCWVLDHPDRAQTRAIKAREWVSGLTPEYQAELVLEAYESLHRSTTAASSPVQYGAGTR